MKHLLLSLLILAPFGLTGSYASDSPTVPKKKVRTFINLLNYIGADYPNAVQNGTVISALEYKEMLGFSKRLLSIYKQLKPAINQSSFTNLHNDLKKLKKLIKQKAGADKIATLTAKIQDKVLALGLVAVTPRRWPDLAKGKKIYTTYCKSCHGARGRGNGVLAAGLSPQPANFQDSVNTGKLSPFQAYNTIRLGVEGTAMRSFSKVLTSREAWNVAFYVNSLRYKMPVKDSTAARINRVLADTVTLRTISLFSNNKWQQLLRAHNINPEQGMAFVRGLTSDPSSSFGVLENALAMLKKAQNAYLNNRYKAARQFALRAYLTGVEPVENQIRALDNELVKKLETKMMAVRSAVDNRIRQDQFTARVEEAVLVIREARDLLNSQEYSFWLSFLLAASILLREGLEAFLIIMVILSVLRSVNASKSVKYVHGGWIVALIAGIGGWFLMQYFIQMSSMQRELMEGIGALVAVAILLYVGFWMHSKSYVSQWTHFIKNKIHRLLNKESMWGLALLSFIVVFREAFESIIFLSSIQLETGSNNGAIILALMTVAVLIAILGYIYEKVTKNIPIRRLFQYSSLMLAVLAVILIGKGVRSLQEAGFIDLSNLPVQWNMPVIGIYSTWPTLLAQLAVVITIGGLWYYSKRLATAQKLQSK